MPDEHVKAQFGRTAESYVTSASHSAGYGLDLLRQHAGEIEGADALDIATGGGHTAFLLSANGARVTALDITPEMLLHAGNEAAKRGLDIEFVEGNAETLPFNPATFDIVTCRIAPHHFIHPDRFIFEASRVLRKNGRLFLIDNVSSEREDFAGSLNHIEKLRDPSHVRSYTVGEWTRWISEAGLDIHHVERWQKSKVFSEWIGRSQTPADVAMQITNYVAGLPDDTKGYLGIEFSHDGLQIICHETAFFSALKIAETRYAS